MYTLVVVALSVLLILFAGFAGIVGAYECLDAFHTPEWLDNAYGFIRDCTDWLAGIR